MKPTAISGTTISGTQSRKNMPTMGKVDTSDFYDDNKISYKYILSITWAWMDHLLSSYDIPWLPLLNDQGLKY